LVIAGMLAREIWKCCSTGRGRIESDGYEK